MKYIILERSENECNVALISHSAVERELLENAGSNPEKFYDTLIIHYQKALEVCIDKNATIIEILEKSSFPCSVKLSFDIKQSEMA